MTTIAELAAAPSSLTTLKKAPTSIHVLGVPGLLAIWTPHEIDAALSRTRLFLSLRPDPSNTGSRRIGGSSRRVCGLGQRQ